jgi:N-methylhydantoinase A/oxoprolinase/acetone carboxylase beta subunit
VSVLVLGVDTGGTYTDGVLMDYETRQVLATAKTPTTPYDLQTCILATLDNLLPDDRTCIGLVSISTTLATNAIAEGKGYPVGLLLLGYDPELAARFRFDERFGTRRVAYLQGGHTLQGTEQAPLDVEGVLGTARGWSDEVEALAVSGYFSPFNPAHEEAAAGRIADALGLPVVLGHQLSSRLNSVERATTAALNAALIPILQDFIGAMRAALDQREIEAPLMVVRGDGALTKAERAAERPVETVHSGPAASAIGGAFLSGLGRAMVVDIGGTTTDLAIVDRGSVLIRDEGTMVGAYRTAVRAADVRSIGLGGDSLLGLDADNRLLVGPERVIPISQLARQHPSVAADLKGMAHRLTHRPSPTSVEYWLLAREPRRVPDGAKAREALNLLRQGPMPLVTLLDRLGLIHPIQFGGPRLVREGVVERSAVTPTDLLHVSGEFTAWDADAAAVATAFMARLRGATPDELIGEVKRLIAERIVAEIVAHISGQAVERAPSHVSARNLGTWLFEESLHRRNPYIDSTIRLDIPLVGIGAPAGIFLPQVADLLGTELVLPPHYEVANAVGAVAGNLVVEKEAWIYPQEHGMHIRGYFARLSDGRRRYPTLDAAVEGARANLSQRVEAEIRHEGAVDPVVDFERVPDGAESYRVRVRAVGNPAMDRAHSSPKSPS